MTPTSWTLDDSRYALRLAQLRLQPDPGWRVEAIWPALVVLRQVDSGRHIALLRYPEITSAAAIELLGRILGTEPSTIDWVVLIGGPPEARGLLEQLVPGALPAHGLAHESDDGRRWVDDSERPDPLAEPPPAAPDWAALKRLINEDLQQMRREHQQARRFSQQMARKPRVMQLILVIIGVVFGLEMLFGGADSMPTLIRMGALQPSLVMEGEIWRMASCTVLHGSLMHVAFNGYVLYSLGSFLERLLGPWRFLLLYCAAALGGSCASLLNLGEGVSVGASGALWGMLGAHALLAWRPRGLLPEAILPGARKASVINLGINVMASFWPHVDWAAHAGGGLVGSLLMFGLLMRGLPRIDASAAAATDRRPLLILPLALLGSGVLAGGAVLGLLQGQPWELSGPPRMVTRSPEGLQASFPVPAILERQPVDSASPQAEALYGDARADPMVISVSRIDSPGLSAELGPEEQAGIVDSLATLEEPDFTLRSPPKFRDLSSRSVAVIGFSFPNGLLYDRLIVPVPDALYVVEVIRWPQYDAWAGVWEQLGRELQPTPAP